MTISRLLTGYVLLLAVYTVSSQFTGNMQPTMTTEDPQAPQQMMTRSQMDPMALNATSTSTSNSMGFGDSVTSFSSSGSGIADDDHSSNTDDDNDDDFDFMRDEEGEASESGSFSRGSGSSSSSLEYECDCRPVRRVSLMGASDYCLAPHAALSSKCGNVDLGESGACPITGAQPCSPKGHVLANDSLCAMDDKDETYKCVASTHDLEIQKKGKKKTKKSSRRRESSTSAASLHLMLTARQVLAIVLCMAAGVLAVV